MNLVELCQKLHSEAGIAGSGPASAFGNTGENDRICKWIANSYEDIQDKHKDWNFLRNDFSFTVSNAQGANYPISIVTDLANWRERSFRCYRTSAGINDEQWLTFTSWDHFRDSRQRGAQRTVIGRPITFSIKPDNSLIFWPIPDDNYTIDGEYFKAAHVMQSDTDTPIFPRHHMVIVWHALVFYAGWVESSSRYASAYSNYNRLIKRLESDRLPQVTIGRVQV